MLPRVGLDLGIPCRFRQSLLNLGVQLLVPECLGNELQPGPVPTLPIAEVVEAFHRGPNKGDHVVETPGVEHLLRKHGPPAKPSGQENIEGDFLLPRATGHEADVLDLWKRAGLPTAGHRDFELPGQVLEPLRFRKLSRDISCELPSIADLVRADAGAWARGHISHAVATGSTGGEVRFSETL